MTAYAKGFSSIPLPEIVQPSRPTEIAGRYELQRRREHFSRVVGVLTNQSDDFVLALSNKELGSLRRFQRATKRIQKLGRRVGHPSGATGEAVRILQDGVLDVLESWWKSDFQVNRRGIPQLANTERKFDYVGTAAYHGWRLVLLVASTTPYDLERGVEAR